VAAGDLNMVAGTTLRFALTWETENEAGELEPVKLHGCTAKFAMRDVKTDQVIATADTTDGIELNPETGEVSVTVVPEKTQGTPPAPLGNVSYEVRVYFPSGDAYPLVNAFIAISKGAID
jgi:hypothetical protein